MKVPGSLKGDMRVLLELDSVSKAFGGLQTLSEVSFGVDDREVVGLIGPNGAGKTTLFNIITGMYRYDSGRVSFRGKELLGVKPFQICQHGIARTFQLVRIFPSMTALENVMVGAMFGHRLSMKEGRQEALRCLGILNLLHLKDTVASHLTHSDRRLVEIARALAARPGLALLDEPLAGLNPTETEKIMELIHKIRKEHGVSILWVEHKIDAVFNICDKIVVLDYGRVLAQGKPDQIAGNRKVVEAYLGESPA